MNRLLLAVFAVTLALGCERSTEPQPMPESKPPDFKASAPKPVVTPPESKPPELKTGAPNTGVVRGLVGKVVDGDGQPVVSACVILCDRKSGIPLCGPELRRLTEEALAGTKNVEPRYSNTDGGGHFDFGEVPDGAYRLVAQSWPDAPAVTKLLEQQGSVIELRGVAENVEVTSGSAPRVTLRPLGAAVLRIDENIKKDGILTVLSTGPPRASAVLGFASWGGDFMPNTIGWNRKLKGVMEVRGLPEGAVHVALFGFMADDESGWGAGSAKVAAAAPADLHVNVNSGWAEGGLPVPPKHLLPIIEELRGKPFLQALHASGISFSVTGGGDTAGFFSFFAEIDRHFDKEVRMSDGRKIPFRDFMEAQMHVMLEKDRKRVAEERAAEKKKAAENK